jgi:hypothetical protein
MGQQQLLLIVLGVIIVGIAVVVGINLFNANAEESTKDGVVSDCTNLGAMAQQYYKKPTSMGGGEITLQAGGSECVSCSGLDSTAWSVYRSTNFSCNNWNSTICLDICYSNFNKIITTVNLISFKLHKRNNRL